MTLIFLFIITFFVVADQFSKQVIVNYIELGTKKEIIPNFFYINHVRNSGAAWSMFEGQQTLFIIITALAIIYFGYMLFRTKYKSKIEMISYLLIIGGAIGNLIDRISFKYVVDFLDFYIFSYDFPVFNIADSFLTIGVILYLLSIILENSNAKN